MFGRESIFSLKIIFSKIHLVLWLLCWCVLKVISNSEAWYYNVTNPELELLESVDTRILRKILKAPRSTQKEISFLELGCVPLREVLMKRRILFFALYHEPK